jgi:hypothetical protein
MQSTNRRQIFNELIILSEIDKYAYSFNSYNIKLAQEAASNLGFVDYIKSVFKDHFDQENPVKSVINFFAPAVIRQVLGGGWIGTLVGVAMSAMNIDVFGMVESVFSSLMPKIQAGKVSESEISSAVSSAVDRQQIKSEALYIYNLTKTAGMIDFVKGLVMKPSSYKKTFFSTFLKWLFITVLSAAGLMMAGDVAARVLHTGKHSDDARVQTRSTQTFFHLKPPFSSGGEILNTSTDVWEETVSNTEQGISDFIVSASTDVYDGLDKYAFLVKTSLGFRKVLRDIMDQNRYTTGGNLIIIPSKYKNEKDIADMFIDEVAAKAQTIKQNQ